MAKAGPQLSLEDTEQVADLAEEFALRLFIPDASLSRLDHPTPEKLARRCLVTWRAARLRLRLRGTLAER